MTKTSLVAGLLGGAAILVAVAFLARSWHALLLVLPILLFLAAGSLLSPPKVEVAVLRSLSRDRSALGQDVEVRLRLINEGNRLAALEVFDILPSGLEVVKGRPHVLIDFRRAEALELAYTVRPAVKGEYAIGPLVLRARDPLGLEYKERHVGAEARLVVAPRFEDIRKIRVVPRRVRQPIGI